LIFVKSLLILSIFLVNGLTLSAQSLREFRAEPEPYMEDLELFLKDTKVREKEALENLLFSFGEVWRSGAIDQQEASAVY